jgi:Domain of unknown function (DUF5753)
MRAQLDRAQQITDHPKVTLRVVPFAAGEYPSARPFALMEFGGHADDAVYLRAHGCVTSRRDRDLVALYRWSFKYMRYLSLEAGAARGFGSLPCWVS